MSYAHRRAPRADLPSPATTITNAILARLEAGTRPWVKPWTGGATPRPLPDLNSSSRTNAEHGNISD